MNPLAVLASRANYVIALGDLIRHIPKEGVEIPVYLADSILVSRKMKFTGEWVNRKKKLTVKRVGCKRAWHL